MFQVTLQWNQDRNPDNECSLVPRSVFITTTLYPSSAPCQPLCWALEPPRRQQARSRDRRRAALSIQCEKSDSRGRESLSCQRHLSQCTPGRGGPWRAGGAPTLKQREAGVSQREGQEVRGGQGRFRQGTARAKEGGRGGRGVQSHRQLGAAATQAHERLTDLLLAGAHALRIEVPVGVEIANGHPQVLHGDHRAEGQV